MRQRERIGWVSASVVSLAAFSFFAGLGMRGLFNRLAWSAQAISASHSYPKFASASPRVPETDISPGQLYSDVLNKLRLYYVEPLPSNTRLATGSVEAMLNQLNDPNSRLLSKAEVDALYGEVQGEYRGLGAVLTIRRWSGRKADDEAQDAAEKKADKAEKAAEKAGDAAPGIRMITVVSVAPGSAAEKTGLRPGDRISEIDGHWVAPVHLSYRLLTQFTDPVGLQDGPPREADELPPANSTAAEREKERKAIEEQSNKWKTATDLASAMEQLNQDERGEHELTVERGNPAKTIKMKIAFGPARAEVFTVRKLNDATGYVQLLAMNAGAARQLGDTLAEWQKSGVKNLVVDLRGSAGGSIDVAREIAGMILGDGKFAVLKERDADRKVVDRPLVIRGAVQRLKPAALSVLVDGGTAGTSELLAAALRDNAGAKLVGSATFGDGTEQEVIRLENGTGISLTRAHMLTSRGVEYDGKGLQPDVAPQGDPVDSAVKALSAVVRPAPAARPATARS